MLLFVHISILLQLSLVKTTALEFSEVYFESHLYHKLLVSQRLESLLVKDLLHCGFLCKKDIACLSYNFGLVENSAGYHVCELLGTRKELSDSHNFIASPNFHHYSFKVRSKTAAFLRFQLKFSTKIKYDKTISNKV